MAEEKKCKEKTDSVPGYLSRLFFCWIFPIFYNGNRRDLEDSDLRGSQSAYQSQLAGDKLERAWFREEARKARGQKPSFRRAVVKAFGWEFIPTGLIQFASIAGKTISPLLFAKLLRYWSANNTMDKTAATYYAIAFIALNWLCAFLNHHGRLRGQQYGFMLRIATGSLIFRKILRMNNGSLGEATAGRVVNILSNDLERFELAFMFLHYFWIVPLQIVVVVYLGYQEAGFAAIIGVAVAYIIILPAQAWLGRLSGSVRHDIAQKTDDRIKSTSEVISGIQVIKMYAWEMPFQKLVEEKRDAELKEIHKATVYKGLLSAFNLYTERITMFITILCFVLFGNLLTADVIYPLQQLLYVVQFNTTFILPEMLSYYSELIVSFKRIQELLCLDDRPDLAPTRAKILQNGFDSKSTIQLLSYSPKEENNLSNGAAHTNGTSAIKPLDKDTAIEIRNVSASWSSDANSVALKDISLIVPKGKLCAIIGPVGAGKSSLLQLLLKELPASAGTVSTNGKMSYSAQEAWLFTGSVRDNILFGLPYDQEKYKKVSNVCALEKDFKQFPYGDQTLVGERGVSLSGGQRARINLARAVYREADIYLLDDPLSAVDANVGRQLFDSCISSHLRARTRLLVTHQVHFLKAADRIVILNKGGIEAVGTYEELLKSGQEFAALLNEGDEENEKETECGINAKLLRYSSRKDIKTKEAEMEEFNVQKAVKEESQAGSLKWEVVTSYFSAGGNWCFVLFTIFMIFMSVTSAAAADYWISYWTNEVAAYRANNGESETDAGLNVQMGILTTGQYLYVFGIMVLICILICKLRIIPFVALCISSSKNLHQRTLSNMMRGVMRFFDTNNSGRILNRFTKDMGAVDEILPKALIDVLQIYGKLGTTLALNAIALYFTVVPSVVLLLLFFIYVKLFLNMAQSVKRLESVAKSPVFGVVTSTLDGITTIRSCGAEKDLVKQFDQSQDIHTRAWNCYLCGGASFSFYLDSMCVTYLAIVIFVFLYMDIDGVIPIGSVGLAVTQSNALTSMLQYGSKRLVDFVAQLTSVERLLEYSRVPTEAQLFEGKVPDPQNWPSEGKIVFQDVNLRYAPEEPLVLKNLNFTIESGWKVGIVGRTGAGKSSIISALFRFPYIEGLMSIDGVDTSTISRQILRSKISIIPQEPVLFSRTIRYNLDPFNAYSDSDIWAAIERVDLKSAIPALDYRVTEGGANFSVGQRQLMCLARAVLRRNKVLIMDEATANVDPHTDNFIQQTIRQQFASCTVITIAHRLNTIIDSDRVVVMAAGQIVEMDHPHNLLSNPQSQFSALVRETGEANNAKLQELAKKSYERTNESETDSATNR